MPRRRTYKPKKRPTAFDSVLAERERLHKEKLDREIDEFLAFTAKHPSVFDKMPRD
jgi:hypothetical protein